jgi:hypothetical protein
MCWGSSSSGIVSLPLSSLKLSCFPALIVEFDFKVLQGSSLMQIVVIQVPSGLHTDDVKLDCTCAYSRGDVPINASEITKV